MITDSVTFELLSTAIDRSALRQAVYAANIANANVEGYRRMEVSFDAELARVQLSMGEQTESATNVVETSEGVALDREVSVMAKNALEYQTLLGAYEKHLTLLRMAIKEGRE